MTELIYEGYKKLYPQYNQFSLFDVIDKIYPLPESIIRVYKGLPKESEVIHDKEMEYLTIDELTLDDKELRRRLEIDIPENELTQKLKRAVVGSSEILERVFLVRVFRPGSGWVSPDGPWDEGYATDYSHWFHIPMRLIFDGSKEHGKVYFDYQFLKDPEPL